MNTESSTPIALLTLSVAFSLDCLINLRCDLKSAWGRCDLKSDVTLNHLKSLLKCGKIKTMVGGLFYHKIRKLNTDVTPGVYFDVKKAHVGYHINLVGNVQH